MPDTGTTGDKLQFDQIVTLLVLLTGSYECFGEIDLPPITPEYATVTGGYCISAGTLRSKGEEWTFKQYWLN